MNTVFNLGVNSNFRRIILVALTSAVITGCGGGNTGGNVRALGDVTDVDAGNNAAGTPAGVAVAESSDSALPEVSADVCSVTAINRWIDARMRDDYIYYDQVPTVNLDDYDDPARLIADLRVAPDIYSSVVDQAENESLIVNSDVTRFGFWVQQASDSSYRFAGISGNSPMQAAGVERGDQILAINGVNYSELSTEQYIEFVIGEPGEILTAVFTVQKGDAPATDITVTKQSYIESTVPLYGTYPQTDDQVAYLRVDAFRGTTTEELDIAIEYLSEKNISELILDLRYNGGGFTRTARKLASQIAGDAFTGQVYSSREFNDKYSAANLELLIERQDLTLDLSRLFVLTTSATASASETLINGLVPLIDVVMIGALTRGKPYTSVAQDYCGKRLNAMSTITTNGAGLSVLGGLLPACTVQDDFLAPSDNSADALTGAAFHFIQNGNCPAAVLAKVSTDTLIATSSVTPEIF